MKILNVIWKFSTGGISKCFLTYAALADVDEKIDVVSVCIDPQNCVYDRKPLADNGIQRIEIKNSLDFSWIRQLTNLIRKEEPDVIFCHGFNGPVVIQTVKSLCGIRIPMVCSYHGLYHAPTKGKRLVAHIYNKVQTMLYKYKADKVILVENYSRQYLLGAGVPADKIVIVHNGIPPLQDIHKEQNTSSDVIRIGLASRMDSVKGIEYLLQAIPIVKSRTDRLFQVEILGNGPLENDLKQLAKTLNIQEEVHFLGYQSDIPQWLMKWDVFCLPSLFEYHSIALLEAMRVGKAIIATKVGGNEESVTDEKEALTVSARNPQSLAEALVRLINDDYLRKTLGANAKTRYEHEFTEDIMKKNLASVFHSLEKLGI